MWEGGTGRVRRPRTARAVVALAGVLLAIGPACGGGGGGSDPVSVSGQVTVRSGTAIDSDVNDHAAPFAPNDDIAEAQEIPTPVILGGYVNVPGKGPEEPGKPIGRSTAIGDEIDLLRASLLEGQVIRLFIAEPVPAVADLDLRLLDLSGSLEAPSTGSGQLLQITVPESGDFLIEVSIYSGYSNYVLTVGQSPTAAEALLAPATPTPRPEVVPGEIVVRYRDDLLGPSAALTPDQLAAGAGMRHRAGRRGGPMLFSCRDERERYQAFHALGIAHLWQDDDPAIASLDAEERLRRDTYRLAKALARRPEVASAAPNFVRRPSAVPADEFYPFQWHYETIHLPQAWDEADGSGVIMAVLDTGHRDHPDLLPQIVDEYDFISNATRAADGDGCDGDATDPGDRGAPGERSSWHGTHVAGTVAARTSLQAGNTEGVAGVAWDAGIMSLRVLGVGGGTDFDIMNALRYAAGLSVDECGPAVVASTPARIANMSLGGPGFSQPFQDLVTELRDDHGLLLVAAAGNEASDTPSYPAAYAGVISVSATGPTNNRAPYSSFGPTIDVAAPGGDLSRDVNGDGFGDGVLSTYFDENALRHVYAFAQGTSMAAPHVAGVLALMLEVNDALIPNDIDALLSNGELTRDIGAEDFFGNGLIDAVRAVNAAASAAGNGPIVLNPVLRVDPDTLSFGLLADSFLVTAANGGGGDDPVLDPAPNPSFSSPSGDWLEIAEEDVDPDTRLGTYRVSVDRSGLANGLYVGTLTFASDANDVEVTVLMQVGDIANAQPNAGHHFVLLTRETEDGDFETVHQASVDPVNGVYSFSFPNVEPGSYFLFAGSDSDGDFTICDPGEACGAYPALDSFRPLEVQTSLSGLVFDTGFEAGVGAASAAATARGGIRLLEGGVRRSLP